MDPINPMRTLVSGKSRIHVRKRTHDVCIDHVVGAILSGWRYDISGLSPAMRTDYEAHLEDCQHCRRRQRNSRMIDVGLISAFTLSSVAFLLAAVVLRRLELLTHLPALHALHLHQTVVSVSLEVVAIAGLIISSILWTLVAIATPLPGFLGEILQEHLPSELWDRLTRRHA